MSSPTPWTPWRDSGRRNPAEAFAVWCAGGDSVVTWGVNSGGDCSAVQGQLKNVQAIQAARWTFVAILADGSVVTWGEPGYDGSWRMDQSLLGAMKTLVATFLKFKISSGTCSKFRPQLIFMGQSTGWWWQLCSSRKNLLLRGHCRTGPYILKPMREKGTKMPREIFCRQWPLVEPGPSSKRNFELGLVCKLYQVISQLYTSI